MCFQLAAERLMEEQPSAKTSNNTSESSVAADEWDDPKYQSDDFKIYEWKVTPCTNTEDHDTDKCPFAHPGEKAVRRDVRVYKYSPEACPATQQKNGECPRGVDCPLSHTVFERWLHPQRFRTQMCTNGPDCPRKSTCFFAHSEDQLRRVVPDIVGSSSTASSLSLAPSVERVSSISSNSSSASSSSTLSGISSASSPSLLHQGSMASCFSLSSRSSTPPSNSMEAAAAAASPKGSNAFSGRVNNSSMLAGLRSPAAGLHTLNKLISRPDAAARSYKPAFSSSSGGAFAGMSPVGGSRGNKAVPSRATASALAAQLKQQLEGHQELLRQQQLQEQQQLEHLQALMQQLPVPGAEGLSSPGSAQHMQLLLEQEISNNMQQAALAAAAAEAANQRLHALRYACMLPAAAAANGFAAASGAGSFGSSTSPVSHGGALFSGPAVCEPLTLGLDWSSNHQQQQLPMHFPLANSNSALTGLMGASASSPMLHPAAPAASAFGHNSNASAGLALAGNGLGLAGNGSSADEQALLAMLLSQMQGSNAAAAAAAHGVTAGLHGLGPACSPSPQHFQAATAACASQAQAAALLTAAAAAQMAPGAGAVMNSYADASLVARLAMQPQAGCHGFFMP